MKGWKTRSFNEKSFFHHRHLGTAERSVLGASFSYGKKDYILGGHPVWELLRILYRMTKRPYVLDGVALGLGYGSAAVRGLQRPISKELMAFHRQEQMRKLKIILKSLLTFKPINKFTLLSE
jgi:biofilm PGA synthesis N-glycosyltransferase PgaC